MPLVGQKISTTRDNFADMIRNNYLLVDKSLMIKYFIESPDNATQQSTKNWLSLLRKGRNCCF